MTISRCLAIVLYVASIAVMAPQAFALPDWVPGKSLLIARRVEAWNAEQKKNVTVELKRCGFFKDGTNSVIAFSGSILNNSDDNINAVIIDFIVQNSKSKIEVLRVRLAIEKRVYKTAKFEFKDSLAPASFTAFDPKREDAKSFYEMEMAANQLGEEFGWSYVVVGAIPDSVSRESNFDVERAMKVDVVLF